MRETKFIAEDELENILDGFEKPRKKRRWKTESLPRIITVRTTEEKYQQISELAAACEESLSGFLVVAALRFDLAKQQQLEADKRETLKAIKELLFTQAKMSVTLNEIAQVVGLVNFKTDGSFDFGELEKIIAEFSVELKIATKRTEKLL